MSFIPSMLLIPEYEAVGFSKRRAYEILSLARMKGRKCEGKGNKSAKRQALVEMYTELDALPLTPHEIDLMGEEDEKRYPMSGYTPQQDQDAADVMVSGIEVDRSLFP